MKSIREQLKRWLERVGKIVKKVTPNDSLLDDINITTWDEFQILEIFVDIDNASYLRDKREKSKRKAVFIGKLFETNGSVIPDNKRYQFPAINWEVIDTDSSESGDDKNENA